MAITRRAMLGFLAALPFAPSLAKSLIPKESPVSSGYVGSWNGVVLLENPPVPPTFTVNDIHAAKLWARHLEEEVMRPTLLESFTSSSKHPSGDKVLFVHPSQAEELRKWL